jgi:small-conductance mechanosensitive channel
MDNSLKTALHHLDNITLQIAGVRLSLLHLLEGALILLAFLGLNRVASQAFNAWVKSMPGASPSFQVLSVKLFNAAFFALAIILVLGGLGLDLTNLAWFSGAIGLGLGIGLQKVVSNLASGFIILADKSIKPGDVIEVGETFGWVNHLKSRYISVITRDGFEYLIPNEDLITGKVINWSYSNNLVRVRIPVGISYGADLELAMKLMLEAAAAVSRVLPNPQPSCCLVGFGDSSINFQLRVWINDPQKGVTGVRSDVFLQIWKRFQQHGIEVPFPQRVLYHKSVPPIKMETDAKT